MLSETSRKRVARSTFPVLLGLAFALLLALLLRNVGAPLLDRHATRQIDTAWVAKGLANGEFSVFRPVMLAHYPDQYGIEGATETEFMLFPLIVSLFYRLFGVHEMVARLVAIAFSMGTAVWVYLLGKLLLDRASGLLAVLLLSTSPLFVFYGRSVQPEAAVLFFAVGAIYLFTSWLTNERSTAYVGAIVLAALAFLTKIPSMYIGLPLLVGSWIKYRGRLFRQWQLWLFVALSLSPALVYYLQAHTIYRETGQSIWGLVGGWTGIDQVDLISSIISPDFYRMILVRARNGILGPWGLMAFLGGLIVRPRKKEEAILYAWLVAVGLFIVIFAQKHRQHEYYQLPLVPVGVLFGGRLLSAVASPANVQLDLILIRRRAGLALVVLLTILNLRAGLYNLAPMYGQSSLLLQVAQATAQLTPADEPIIIIHDWAREGEIFYYANRRGWSIWIVRTPEGEYGDLIVAERVKTDSGWQIPTTLESHLGRMDMLREQGAGSLVISLEKGTREAFERSSIGKAVAAKYPLLGAGAHWLIYDLQ